MCNWLIYIPSPPNLARPRGFCCCYSFAAPGALSDIHLVSRDASLAAKQYMEHINTNYNHSKKLHMDIILCNSNPGFEFTVV